MPVQRSPASILRRAQTRMTVNPETVSRASKSPSRVTTGSPRDAAIAAIQRSLMRTRRPVSARWIRRRAHMRAAPSSTGEAVRSATASSVDIRRALISADTAASTPTLISANVITVVAPSSGHQRLVQFPTAFVGNEHRRVEHPGCSHRSGPRSSVVSPASSARSSRSPGSAWARRMRDIS